MQGKADDEDRLAPVKEDNTVMRKMDRNDVAISRRFNYMRRVCVLVMQRGI